MKRLHLFGLTLMTVFAMGSMASAVASAELSILPTPSVGSPVSFTFASAGTTLLESVSGKKIECTSVSGSGQATSARSGPVEFTFVGCKNHATLAKCTGLFTGEGSGEIKVKAEGQLRHLLDFSGVSLVVLLGHIHFSCAGILFLVLGCVASMDLLNEKGGSSIVEKLVSKVYADFLQEKGQQKPLEILNDASTADEVCMLTVQEEGRAAEEAGQLGEGTIENFKQGGSVTLLVHLK